MAAPATIGTAAAASRRTRIDGNTRLIFQNPGHANVLNTAGGRAYGHIDGPATGARSMLEAFACWQAGADPLDWAQDHQAFARAFVSFPHDADRLFPGWRERLNPAADA
jgi:ribulose-bisphosphate carboxylase large chain